MELHKKSELYGRGWLAGLLLQSRDMSKEQCKPASTRVWHGVTYIDAVNRNAEL